MRFETIPGAYAYEDQKIVLNEDFSCQLENVVDYEVTECSWSAEEGYSDIYVRVEYDYRYKSSWSNRYYNSSSSKSLTFDADRETLELDWETFKKTK